MRVVPAVVDIRRPDAEVPRPGREPETGGVGRQGQEVVAVVDDVLGARHASTLNGALLPPGKRPSVTVVLEASAAPSPAWQAATWLLVDLVSRGEGHAATLTVVTGRAGPCSPCPASTWTRRWATRSSSAPRRSAASQPSGPTRHRPAASWSASAQVGVTPTSKSFADDWPAACAHPVRRGTWVWTSRRCSSGRSSARATRPRLANFTEGARPRRRTVLALSDATQPWDGSPGQEGCCRHPTCSSRRTWRERLSPAAGSRGHKPACRTCLKRTRERPCSCASSSRRRSWTSPVPDQAVALVTPARRFSRC